MKDDGLILKAWAEARRANQPAMLATVVKVSGSAYRRPGARMLFTQDGARIGSVSGGCLEGDILKKAWWLTEGGRPALRIYDNTTDNETAWEVGLGCNGIIHILLERWDAGSDQPVARLLEQVQSGAGTGVVATVIDGPHLGAKFVQMPDGLTIGDPSLMVAAFPDEVFIDVVEPPVPLIIAGSDHDVLPVARLARELGWHVTIADTRSHQTRPERFPDAHRVLLCDPADPIAKLAVSPSTVAVVMGHSYPQDKAFATAFAARDMRYLGVLGPRQRTERMFAESGVAMPDHVHSPVGLDIGADTSEEIAFSIISEIQAVLTGRPAGMLRDRTGPIHLR